MAPAAGFLVNEADENFGALDGSEIDDDVAHGFIIVAGGLEEDLLAVGADEFDAGTGETAAADKKGGVGLGGPERSGSERALRGVAADFVSADPEIAVMIAFHVAAAGGNGIALVGLGIEGVAGGGPIL